MDDNEGLGQPSGADSEQPDDAEQSQLSRFPLSESVLEGLVGVLRTAEKQQTILARMVEPLLNTYQEDWPAQRSTMIRNLSPVISQLVKSIDFDMTESATRLMAYLVEQREGWLKSIASISTAMRAEIYPPNLRSIEGLDFEEIDAVVMVDGIALYGLPRTSIAEALIRADKPGRREILGRRWKTILTDCRDAVQKCNSEAVSVYTSFALAAIDALEGGHTQASQALTGSLIEAILRSYLGAARVDYIPARDGKRTQEAYYEFTLRQFIALAPMWQTYQLFTFGRSAPTTFSRHATAHTVSRRQYNRRNAIQGLMFACSLLRRLDEEAGAPSPIIP